MSKSISTPKEILIEERLDFLPLEAMTIRITTDTEKKYEIQQIEFVDMNSNQAKFTFTDFDSNKYFILFDTYTQNETEGKIYISLLEALTEYFITLTIQEAKEDSQNEIFEEAEHKFLTTKGIKAEIAKLKQVIKYFNFKDPFLSEKYYEREIKENSEFTLKETKELKTNSIILLAGENDNSEPKQLAEALLMEFEKVKNNLKLIKFVAQLLDSPATEKLAVEFLNKKFEAEYNNFVPQSAWNIITNEPKNPTDEEKIRGFFHEAEGQTQYLKLWWMILTDKFKDRSDMILSYPTAHHLENGTPLQEIASFRYTPKFVFDYLLKQNPTIDFQDRNVCNKNTALHLAVKSGNIDGIKSIIEHGANLELQNKELETPLTLITNMESRDESKMVEIATYLLDHGAKINAVRKYNYTLLMDACYNGYSDLVELLVSRNADVTVINSYSQSNALHWAVDNAITHPEAALKIIKTLLAKMPNLINSKITTDSFGEARKIQTALHLAATDPRSLDALKLLCEYAPTIDEKDDQDFTPLLVAITKGNIEGLKYLVEEKNADLKVKDAFGINIYIQAIESKNLDVLKYLVEKSPPDPTDIKLISEIMYKAYNAGESRDQPSIEDLKFLEYLVIEKKLDINAKTEYGHSILYWAILSDNLDYTKKLIELGASLYKIASLDISALHLALSENHKEISQYLVEIAKIDVNTQSTSSMYERAPIVIAIKNQDLEMVKYLVMHGARITDLNEHKLSGLHIAVEYGTLDIVKYLVEDLKANVNTNYPLGTPLEYAAQYGKFEIAKYLIAHGAEVTENFERKAKDLANSSEAEMQGLSKPMLELYETAVKANEQKAAEAAKVKRLAEEEEAKRRALEKAAYEKAEAEQFSSLKKSELGFGIILTLGIGLIIPGTIFASSVIGAVLLAIGIATALTGIIGMSVKLYQYVTTAPEPVMIVPVQNIEPKQKKEIEVNKEQTLDTAKPGTQVGSSNVSTTSTSMASYNDTSIT